MNIETTAEGKIQQATDKVLEEAKKPCACLSGTKDRLTAYLTEKYGGKAQVSAVDYVNVGILKAGNTLTAQPVLQFSYLLAARIPGGEFSKPKKHTTTVTFSYCPFCGKKYPTT